MLCNELSKTIFSPLPCSCFILGPFSPPTSSQDDHSLNQGFFHNNCNLPCPRIYIHSLRSCTSTLTQMVSSTSISNSNTKTEPTFSQTCCHVIYFRPWFHYFKLTSLPSQNPERHQNSFIFFKIYTQKFSLKIFWICQSPLIFASTPCVGSVKTVLTIPFPYIEPLNTLLSGRWQVSQMAF